jgi:hypothetical protein
MPSFVSKVDDDSFVNVPGFYSECLAAHLHPLAQDLVIARSLGWGSFQYPGGQFYTLREALVVKLADLPDRNPIGDMAEDMLVGHLLQEASKLT